MAENKGDKDDETTTEDKDGSNGNPPDGGSNSGNTAEPKADKDGIREMVREEIKEALKGLKPDGDGTPTPRRNDIEAAAERMVREASERLEARQQHERDHQELRNGNQPPKDEGKPVTEDAPKKVRKLTKIFWGDAD